MGKGKQELCFGGQAKKQNQIRVKKKINKYQEIKVRAETGILQKLGSLKSP